MGFGAGGAGALPNHEHTLIALDGGPLSFVNTTVASLLAGSITYSDGAALQELVIGGAGDALHVSVGGVPSWVSSSAAHESGMIAAWSGTLGNIPASWLLCDGASIATATYPDLFTAIGYVYGGAGANFNTPDLVNYFIRGQNTQTAATGGADSLTLTEAQMPQHSHVVTDPGHTHVQNVKWGGSGTTCPAYTNTSTFQSGGSNQTATTGITLADTGSSNSFDNRPAFIEMQYIIKT